MLVTAELPPNFDVVLAAGRRMDPLGSAEDTGRALLRTRDAGATIVTGTIAANSSSHYREQLAVLQSLVERI